MIEDMSMIEPLDQAEKTITTLVTLITNWTNCLMRLPTEEYNGVLLRPNRLWIQPYLEPCN